MATPPFLIDESAPSPSSFISSYPANEQTNRDIIEDWLLTISTNMGVLRADAMPDQFDAGMDFITSISISAADTNGNTSVLFRDEADVLQGEIVWDESEDAFKFTMYADDGTTPRGSLVLTGDTATMQFNGSEVLRANSAIAAAIVGTGALNAGSITSGFGSIDIGTDTLAAGNTTITGTGSFSGVLSALSSLELGHATDTTLSRGAAGFLAVEGKRVPSPASQATGDTLYRGATEWERLAIGTSLQRYRTNVGGTAPEWYTLNALTERQALSLNTDYYHGEFPGSTEDLGTERIIARIPHAGTVTSITHRMGANSLTFALRINGVNITGISAVSATTTSTTTNASGANTVSEGDYMELVFSNNGASDTDFSFTIEIERT